MSIKRSPYKGLSLPDNDIYLTVRPCITAICYGNKPAAKLLSALLFRWNPGVEVDMEQVERFSLQLTQENLLEALCDECVAKTLHDAAIPCLHLFGYLNVDETTYPMTYTVNLHQVRPMLEVYKELKRKYPTYAERERLYEELEKSLIVQAAPIFPGLNKRNFQDAIEKSLIVIREISNSTREISNSPRGRKPRNGAVRVAKNRSLKNNNNKNKENENAVFASANDGDSSSFCLADELARLDTTLDTLMESIFTPSPLPEQTPITTPLEEPPVVQATIDESLIAIETTKKRPSSTRRPKSQKHELTLVLTDEERAAQETFKARCHALQEKIIDRRGGKLRTKQECINEWKCVEELVKEYTDKQIDAIIGYMETEVWPYKTQPHKIGGHDIWKESRPAAKVLRERREAREQGRTPTILPFARPQQPQPPKYQHGVPTNAELRANTAGV